jgi:hypothetical protein
MWICSIIGWGLGPLSGMSCGGKYIENIIFDLPIKDSGQHQYSDFKPKKLFSYFKSISKDNSGISPLKKDGILYTDTVEKTIFWSRLEQLDLLGLSSLYCVCCLDRMLCEG